MIEDIAGKTVFITGASTGIGVAAARAFVANGARVVIHYNSSKSEAEAVENEVRNHGAEALLIHGNVTRSGGPEEIVAKTVKGLRRLDILINNAGGLVKRTPVAEYTVDFVHSVLALNVV